MVLKTTFTFMLSGIKIFSTQIFNSILIEKINIQYESELKEQYEQINICTNSGDEIIKEII
jgi:hypothetical protein